LDRGSDTFSEVVGASEAGVSEDVPLGGCLSSDQQVHCADRHATLLT
jgi:hypothetical protein